MAGEALEELLRRGCGQALRAKLGAGLGEWEALAGFQQSWGPGEAHAWGGLHAGAERREPFYPPASSCKLWLLQCFSYQALAESASKGIWLHPGSQLSIH